MKLSIIIVNYNVKFFIEQCLQSVFKAIEKIEAEVIVVDNNSVDGSVKMLQDRFKEVTLIANTENYGFSKANNQALEIAKGAYIVLLNPDTLVEPDTFSKIIDFAENTTDAGGIGVRMIDGKGRFLPESKRGLPTPTVAFYKIFGLSKLFPKSKVFGTYHLSYLPENETHSVDILSGAFMFLRKSVLDKIGYLDETFFMYGEDIDLSYRIIKAGYKNYYFPHTRIIHYKGESTKKSSVNYVFVFYNAMIIFAAKHFSKNNAKLFSLLINLAIYMRAFLAILNRFLKKIAQPLIDFSLLFVGISLIKNIWQHNFLNHDFEYYPIFYMGVVVPIYIMIWIFSIFFNGGYDKPISLKKVFQGIAGGTLIILVVYALLPESLRFSRALILLGSVWACLSLCGIRWTLYLCGFKQYKIGLPAKRIAIIGNDNELKRTNILLKQFSYMPEFVGNVYFNDNNHNENAIGLFSQIKDIIDIFKINELIFCAKDVPHDKIIDTMSDLHKADISFKIIPPESLFIVGSNSIEASESFFTISVNPISKSSNLRLKYAFDFLMALALLISYPLWLFFSKKPLYAFRAIITVLLLKKTWVSYLKMPCGHKLPLIKEGILSPLDAFKLKNMSSEMEEKICSMYARNYKLYHDFLIVLKNFTRIGVCFYKS